MIDVALKPSVTLKRKAILEAARSVFARKGYADTAVEDITEQAGIAKGTLYLYFPSKDAIYLAALLEDARRLDGLAREAMAAATSWEGKVRAYVETKLDYCRQHQDFIRIYVTEFRTRCMMGKPIEPELYQLIQQGEALLADAFSEAAARGEIRNVDPVLAAYTVCDITRGLIERELRGWGRRVGPDDVEFALELVCRGLR